MVRQHYPHPYLLNNRRPGAENVLSLTTSAMPAIRMQPGPRGGRSSVAARLKSGYRRGVDSTQRRKAANEAVFREVNEHIEDLHPRFARGGEPLWIVCECDHLDCAAPLGVTLEVYERVRRDSSCFIVTPGHEDTSVERVVETGSDYVIVQKAPGEPRQVAEESDPRR